MNGEASSDTLTVQRDLATFYALKPASYFSNARADFVDALPVDPDASVLEVGCGTGATGALAISEGRCGRYVGIELMEDAAAEAREVLSEVRVGNVESMDFDWPAASFDAVIFSEVLEHLIEPGRVVHDLARFIRPGGMLLASSPNVSHWRVIAELLRGQFRSDNQGVFDRTHLRWFTPASFSAMFEEAGFEVVGVGPVTPFSPRTEIISRLSAGRLNHLFMTQIAVVAIKR